MDDGGGHAWTPDLQARFDDVVKGHRKLIREVAILELVDDKIASLREYWASQPI